MLLVAITLLSAAALGYEILLLRLFSIAQWHHLTYMVISLALLGYGASGTLLTLARRPLLAVFRTTFAGGALLFAVSGVVGFALAQRLPSNPLELLWDPRQSLYLAAGYLLLAVPFLGAAGAVGLCLTAAGERPGAVYRADLVGAGLGAVGVVTALFFLEPETCLRGVSGLATVSAVLAVGARLPWEGREPPLRRPPFVFLLLVALLAPAAWPAKWLAPRPSEYKPLSLALRLPGSRVVEETSSPLGRLTLVASPEIPFRFAPGLSLTFEGELPEQWAIFTDGDGPAVVDRWDGGEFPTYLDFLPSALAYSPGRRPRVLVLDAGGGVEVLQALGHGARRVDVVAADPARLRLLRERCDRFAGGLLNRPEVAVHVAEGRSFVAREGAGGWDVIRVSLGAAPSAAGAAALGAGHLLTVEGVADLLRRLEPGGVLAVTSVFRPPPRQSLKLFITAVVALERLGVGRPGDRLALIRDWGSALLLVKNGDWTMAERREIRAFCARRAYDPAFLPGLKEEETNRVHRVEEPTLHRAAVAFLEGDREAFLAAYKFHVAAATDDRPYFSRFFKWRSLPELLRLRRQGGAPLLESGYLALVLVVLQAAAAAAVLILLPLAVLRRRRGGDGAAGSGEQDPRGGARTVGYFFALGLAFLFLEIAVLEKATLLLGNPVYAAALVLGAFLIFAGLGSGLTARLGDLSSSAGRPAGRLGRVPAIRAVAVALAVLAVVEAVGLAAASSRLLAAPLPARALATVLAIAPLAFLMGMPFPLGLARVAAQRRDRVPWAWGINGCASVLSPPLATLAAVHLGFTAVVLLAAGLYLAAGWMLDGAGGVAQG